MTALTKPVRREIELGVCRRPVCVELDPVTKRIVFHEKGCRTRHSLLIATAYALAIRAGEDKEA